MSQAKAVPLPSLGCPGVSLPQCGQSCEALAAVPAPCPGFPGFTATVWLTPDRWTGQLSHIFAALSATGLASQFNSSSSCQTLHFELCAGCRRCARKRPPRNSRMCRSSNPDFLFLTGFSAGSCQLQGHPEPPCWFASHTLPEHWSFSVFSLPAKLSSCLGSSCQCPWWRLH